MPIGPQVKNSLDVRKRPDLFGAAVFGRALVLGSIYHCQHSGDTHIPGDMRDVLARAFAAIGPRGILAVFRLPAVRQLGWVSSDAYFLACRDVALSGDPEVAASALSDVIAQSRGEIHQCLVSLLAMALGLAGYSVIQGIFDDTITGEFAIPAADFPPPYREIFTEAEQTVFQSRQ